MNTSSFVNNDCFDLGDLQHVATIPFSLSKKYGIQIICDRYIVKGVSNSKRGTG